MQRADAVRRHQLGVDAGRVGRAEEVRVGQFLEPGEAEREPEERSKGEEGPTAEREGACRWAGSEAGEHRPPAARALRVGRWPAAAIPSADGTLRWPFATWRTSGRTDAHGFLGRGGRVGKRATLLNGTVETRSRMFRGALGRRGGPSPPCQ